MSKSRLKLLIFLGGAAVLLPTALIVFSLLSQFVTQFQRGAVPASIFHGHSLTIPSPDQAEWIADTANLNSFLPSRSEREEIIGTYYDAWEALARACLTGDASALATYWAGGAIQQAKAAIAGCAKNTVLVHKWHQLQLQFFSDDGTVVSFNDDSFDYSVTVAGVTDDLRASALITMTLDTGVWRIRQSSFELR